MMDKINLEDNSRYVKRLHSKVMRKRRIQLIIFSIVVSAALVWLSITVFNTLKNFHFPSIKLPAAASPVAKKTKTPKLTFAVIGIEQREYEQFVTGINVVAYDKENKTLKSLAFKKSIRLQIPGYGLDVVEKSLFAGLDSALASMTNVTGVQVTKYVMIDSEDYSTGKPSVRRVFDSIYETNFTQAEQKKLAEEFKKIENKDINILEAPSKLIAVSKKPYEQLKKKEVNRLVQILWDLPKPIKRPKVIVLNGIGTSGLAGKVAMKIIKAGYEVIDIKNANSFNYKNTLIIIYSQKMQDRAISVQRALGYGNVMLELDKQGLTDMTVIIGKNHKE